MTDEQRQEIMRRQAEGMRAMRNFWGATADAQNNIIPDPPPPTLWARFKRWIRA